VICSDGLWGLVPDAVLYNTITSADSPQDACEKLVDAALKAGGPDNITVIIVQYDPSGSG
jgi:protein phosphatase